MKIALIGRDAHRVLAFRGSLIRAAQIAGHEVIAITGHTDEATRASLAEAGVRWFGAPLHGGSVNPIKDLAYARALRCILHAEGVRAVFAYNPKCLAHGPIAARKAGVQRVVGMVTGLGHGFIGHGWREGLVRSAKAALYRRAFAACDAVLFQNTDDLQELERCGAVTPAVRPRVQLVAGSGVDLTTFPQVPVPEGAHFLMIARPLREKGLAEYFDAARQVAQDMPAATFTWLGPMRDANPSAIDADTLRDWLHDGPVRHVDEQTDVRPWLAACSVFVLPSHREGTSKVVLEAMATGRAIITTDAPGCRNLVTQDSGMVVPVGDAKALANAMRALAHDASQRARMGEGARAVATARFDAAEVNAVCLRALTGEGFAAAHR